MAWVAAGLAVLLGAGGFGCLARGVEFECVTDEGCTLPRGEGRCEASASCSYPDDACPSGRRYGPYADDSHRDRCVEGEASEGSSDSTADDPSAWLIYIDETAARSALRRIDLATGVTTEQCTFETAANYNSLTFAGDGTLYGHNLDAAQLERIDPCTCDVNVVATTGRPTLNLTNDGGSILAGIDIDADVFVLLDPASGELTVTNSLDRDFSFSGVAWLGQGAVALDTAVDQLFSVDPSSGGTTVLATLPVDFTTVGIEAHPATGELYVCGAGDGLYRIDADSGSATLVATIEVNSLCDNLAAPWTEIACLD